MEKIDKNQLIGFGLLMLMWAAYMYFMPATPPEEAKTDAKTSAKVAQKTSPSTVSNSITDTTRLKAAFGDFASAAVGTEKEIVVKTEKMQITFSSLGGKVKKVELFDYKTYDDFKHNVNNPIVLIDDTNSNMTLEVTSNKGIVDLKKLYFTTNSQAQVLKSGDSTKVIFSLPLGENQAIEQIYTVHGNSYNVEYDLNFKGLDALIQNQPVKFTWQDKLKKLENDLAENRKNSQINFWETEDEFSDLGANSNANAEKVVEQPIKWFSFKQKYFVSGFMAKSQAMKSAALSIDVPTQDSSYVKSVKASVQLPIEDIKAGKGNYRFYFGPNDLKEVSLAGEGFQRNVYLGYEFVRPINRYIFVPLFNWFEKIVSNYGLLIILVVLTLKTILTPLIYKSYVSSAKMRILAPEIEKMKEQIGDDSMKVQQETMKLYQQFGVNPMSGCVPLLLQMPILMSVFFLFPNMIMFRQKSFLWAADLSTYDAPLHWATTLPLIGNHISIFVVLMTLSSLAFTYYNNQITPNQPGPIDMKKMSYIFPLVFFFVLNSFPAALSFYYLVSNLVTIAQQLIVKRFVDEDKIKAILHDNKVKYNSNPEKKKGRFASYLEKQLQASEEMRKTQDELKKNKKK